MVEVSIWDEESMEGSMEQSITGDDEGHDGGFDRRFDGRKQSMEEIANALAALNAGEMLRNSWNY